MMEKFRDFRDKLSKDIWDTRKKDPELAKKMLEEESKTVRYGLARDAKQENVDKVKVDNILDSVENLKPVEEKEGVKVFEVIVHPKKEDLEKEGKEFYEEVPIVLLGGEHMGGKNVAHSVESLILKYGLDKQGEKNDEKTPKLYFLLPSESAFSSGGHNYGGYTSFAQSEYMDSIYGSSEDEKASKKGARELIPFVQKNIEKIIGKSGEAGLYEEYLKYVHDTLDIKDIQQRRGNGNDLLANVFNTRAQELFVDFLNSKGVSSEMIRDYHAIPTALKQYDIAGCGFNSHTKGILEELVTRPLSEKEEDKDKKFDFFYQRRAGKGRHSIYYGGRKKFGKE